jgi:hypothetical protein
MMKSRYLQEKNEPVDQPILERMSRHLINPPPDLTRFEVSHAAEWSMNRSLSHIKIWVIGKLTYQEPFF